MKGTPITVRNNVKILGLTFDKNLYWRTHINELISSCKRRLNIRRCMSNITWGADREVLLNLFKMLVLSKMEYGLVVFAAARKTHL
nr:unnamed protein product [Callosobruchus chinensis]